MNHYGPIRDRTPDHASESSDSDQEDTKNDTCCVDTEETIDSAHCQNKDTEGEDPWERSRFFVANSKMGGKRKTRAPVRRSYRRLNSSNNKSVTEQASRVFTKNRPVKRKAKTFPATESALKRRKTRQETKQTASGSRARNTQKRTSKIDKLLDSDDPLVLWSNVGVERDISSTVDGESDHNSDSKEGETGSDVGTQGCADAEMEVQEEVNTSDSGKNYDTPQLDNNLESGFRCNPDNKNDSMDRLEEVCASDVHQTENGTDSNREEAMEDIAVLQTDALGNIVRDVDQCYSCNKPTPRASNDTVVCITCGRLAHKSCVLSADEDSEKVDYTFCSRCLQQ